MGLLKAIMKAGGDKLGPELWLLYLKTGLWEVVEEAERLARERLLAIENKRDVIGPHVTEMAELEEAWKVLALALENRWRVLAPAMENMGLVRKSPKGSGRSPRR